MGSKKRRRSESFQAEQGGDDDARKRLAAFHARMFELPHEETVVKASETPRVVFKSKKKKIKKKSNDVDDGEPVPVVKFNKIKPKKEKKKVAAVKVVTGPAVVKVPGMTTVKNKTMEKVAKKVKVKSAAVQVVKKTQVQASISAPQWHSMQMDEGEDDDGVDPLEQALGSMKEIATKQVDKPPHKKHKTVTGKAVAVPNTEKPKESEEPVKKGVAVSNGVMDCNTGGNTTKPMTKRQKKNRKEEKKKKKRLIEACNNKPAAETPAASTVEANNATTTVSETVSGSDTAVKTTTNDIKSSTTGAPSPKSPGSRKKRKRSKMMNGINSVSPKTQTSTQPRQGRPLIISDNQEDQSVMKIESVNDTNTVTSKKANMPGKKGKAAIKAKKVVPNEETQSIKPLTPIAASLAKDAKKKNDMFLPVRETPRVPTAAPKRVEKVVSPQVVQLPDESSSSESDEDGGYDFSRNDDDSTSLFSRLIDSAARERWELVEVGRLVRLFAAEWSFKESKTARFLCDTCPELVSVDFLEGLGVNLSAKQLVQVFETGSGNSGVLMNKMASAVENGHLSVRDPSFVSALERRVALMESNDEVVELLHPLLESLSTVRDVGCLLKQLCEHWQLERKLALVQQVLLSNVFDDLDGNQDEILLDLPDLTGRLDFPSRLDQEDVDENGNLKGFLANEDSDFSGEEGSEDEVDDEDSEDDEDPYEGETDSEDEVEIAGRPRGRNQFIEDEADVGEEEEEEEEEEHHDDDPSSSSDSD